MMEWPEAVVRVRDRNLTARVELVITIATGCAPVSENMTIEAPSIEEAFLDGEAILVMALHVLPVTRAKVIASRRAKLAIVK